MSIKLIVDIDGKFWLTVKRNQYSWVLFVPSKGCAKQAGVKVVIATGRPIAGVWPNFLDETCS